jgi:predicted phosphoribosyltransferase
MLFRDRREAGRRLVPPLARWADGDDVWVLALPRGGVPVAWEVARGLGVRLDTYVVRRLLVPGHPEQALGAVASGGVLMLDHPRIDALGLGQEQLGEVVRAEWQEVLRREHDYRGNEPLPDLGGAAVILVDDGLSTGPTLLAALAALRRLEPRRLVAAAPVMEPETFAAVRSYVEAVVCAATPRRFRTVAHWYQDYAPITDEEVRTLLAMGRVGLESPQTNV